MRSFRDKYLVSALPSHMQDSDLGSLVEAYDNTADRSYGCMVVWWIAVVVGVAVWVTYLGKEQSSIVKLTVPFALVVVGIIVHFVLLSRFNSCQRIFVCQRGVQWEQFNLRSGRIVQSRTVYWEQVGSVVSRKSRRYTTKSNDDSSEEHYRRTVRTLEMNAPHGATLLKISGKYANEYDQEELFTWIWFAVKALELQWACVQLPQLISTVHEQGQVVMPVKGDHVLLLTPEAISYKDKTISANHLVVSWRAKDETLAIRDSSEKRNMVQKFFNLKELTIPVSTMPNGCLVLPLLLQLYGVKPTAAV